MNQAEKKWLKILEDELEKEMNKAPSVVSSHDIHHIGRVWKNVKQTAESMNVDWEVLIAATFLHDLGRHYPKGVGEHGPISAPLAKKILERVDFPTDKIENVIISIKYHDESFPSDKRTTQESKVLYDADKLDMFGAVGVSRYLIFYAMRNKTLKETVEYALKNLPLRFNRLEFDKTKKFAEPNFEFALQYFKKLKQEID